jgi:hypothetical protein
MSRSNALLHAHLRAERDLLTGHVRECKQWSCEDLNFVQYDFAYRDPASGRHAQYCVRATYEDWMTDEQMDKMVAEPALACLAMMLQRKCGIREALTHKIPLSLPLTAIKARFV